MPSTRVLLAGLVALAVLAVGGALAFTGDTDPAVATPPSGSPSDSTPPSAEPSPQARPAAPLTGVEVDDRSVLERPAVAVKIENSAKARPQSGLEVADVVYEELTEGGVTRFIAIYHSQVPATVGPVRSARLVDAQIVPAFGGVLAMSGARPDVIATLRSAGVTMIADDGHGTIFHREPGRSAPSNLFAAGADLFAAAGDRPAVEPAWSYSEAVPAGASTCPPPPTAAASGDATPVCTEPGAGIEVTMSRVSVTGWTYDADAAVYRRSQDGQPHTVTGAGRIGAANVLVLGTDVGPGPCCDAAGNPMTATRVTGEGTGVLLRDGKRYEIAWSKSAPDAHVEVRGPDGQPIAFKPGPTWVLLAPESGVPGV